MAFHVWGVCIGILIANGRRADLLDEFTEIMDICCAEIPQHKAQSDFSLREIGCCLLLLEKQPVVPEELLDKWKRQLSVFDPWTLYNAVAASPETPVGNWALFAAVSEYVRYMTLCHGCCLPFCLPLDTGGGTPQELRRRWTALRS